MEILVVIGIDAAGHFSTQAQITSVFGSPSQIGELFLTDHLLAFEITSIVLLIAAVGGVILGIKSEAETVADTDESSVVGSGA